METLQETDMPPLNTHKFQIDWKLNIANILTLCIAVLSGIGAWYNLKQEVYLNHQEAALKFMQVERFMADQKRSDELQDQARERLASDVKDAIRENTKEVKIEIRELRTDLHLRKPFK